MTHPIISLPDPTTLTEYQKNYIRTIPLEMHLLEALEFSNKKLLEVFTLITEEKSMFKYMPNKWSIKTLVLHIVDTERVFQYRAMSIARGATEHLPSFDENIFAANSNADQRTFKSIMEEYINVSEGFRILVENLDLESIHRTGIANSQPITPCLIGFLACGHRLHHLHLIHERYLL